MTFNFQGKCHCAMQFSSFLCDKALYRLTIHPNEMLYTYTTLNKYMFGEKNGSQIYA